MPRLELTMGKISVLFVSKYLVMVALVLCSCAFRNGFGLVCWRLFFCILVVMELLDSEHVFFLGWPLFWARAFAREK